MDNSQADSLIIAFLLDKATEDECKTLEKWIQATPENQRYFQQVYNVWKTAGPAFDPDQISVEKAEEKICRQIRKKNHSFVDWWGYWQRIAAVLLLPVLLFAGYLLIKKTAQYKEEVYQELTTPYGMISKINLPDGSNVWLNGGSTLAYPVHFEKGKRHVRLTGEGYFEVESDPENTFIVETRSAKITATGTTFNVNAYEADTLTAVTLAKGSVDIQFGKYQPVRIQPNDHLALHNNTLRYSVRKTDSYRWYAWKDGVMIFRDDPLAYVFKRLEQTFNVEIIIKDPGITDAPYRATFGEESLNEILRLLEKSAPIYFVYLDRKISENQEYKKQQIEVHSK